MCGFLNQQKVTDLLKDRPSPVLIEVINSCNIKANDRTLSVVVDFQPVPNSYLVRVKPKEDYEEDDPVPETPWLDVLLCDCNCSNFPLAGKVIVDRSSGTDTTEEFSHQSSTDTSDESKSEGSDEELNEDLGGETAVSEESEQFTEYFALKGSSYHEDCQKTLRKCKQLQLKKEAIGLRVSPEPGNPRDRNAVIVEANIDSSWSRVGYIPKEKLRKTVLAIRNNDIKKVEFKFIGFMYVPDLNDWLYHPRVMISKVGHWLPTDANYKYNDPID
ncbi:hypothetical protein ACROYT_G015202 [Oculina patagonica]